MASPNFRINGNAVGTPASVAAAGAVTATLDSTDGVRQVQWSISSTDETTVAANYTLVQSGSVGQTVACTALTAGTAAILRAKINGGLNIATGLNDPNGTEATGKFYVLTAGGHAVGCVNEIVEHNGTYGWSSILNPIIRAVPSAVVTSVSGTAPIVSSGGATPAISISASSGAAAGSMSTAHYTLVNDSTASATVSTIMKRDAAGRAQVVDPSANADIDTKGARNTAIAAATASTTFTSAGSYVIPTTCKMVRIAIQAAGGGGGGGATRGAGVATGGGGAGGGGGYSEHIFDAALLRAIGASIAYDPGAAGAVGPGSGGIDGDGSAGGNATDATASIGATLILAAGGGGGGAGATVAGGAGGAGGDGGESGTAGGAGGAGGAAVAGTTQIGRAAAGGGGGGGITAGDVAGSGGSGGSIPVWRGGSATGATGGPPDNAGSNGQNCVAIPLGGGGGGGGGAQSGDKGYTGGDGGISGGGGAGGGAGRNGSIGGDGGAGKAGCIIIEVW